MPVCRKGAEIETRKKREERREKREEGVLPTSEPSLNPLRMCWNRAKKIHLISEKLILAVAKERFERTIPSPHPHFPYSLILSNLLYYTTYE